MELEEGYYRWIINDVIKDEKTRDYNFLFLRLWMKEYYTRIKGDENRAVDGKYLRYIYCDKFGKNLEELNSFLGCCRVLEMLVAFANRSIQSISFEKTHLRANDLLWIMINNLGFEEFTDNYMIKSGDPESEIEYILSHFMDGKGIYLFDLAKQNRKEELWDQKNRWIIEKELF